ncbi:MAG: type II secretion system F family protein [Aestuariivirgaceae bacterium]|nr:type II secretion system F family protein [Aestuariivirgaceae bacterium]
MFEQLATLMEPQNLMQVIIGLAGFATIYTLGSGISRGDPFKERMKVVAGEKEKLRQMARQEPVSGSRLRVQSTGGVMAITELFNLQHFLQASGAREKLKMAGLRTEKHVYTFVLARLICPPLFLIVAVFYTTVQFQDLETRTQIMAWVGAAAFGYFLPGLIVGNMIEKRQKSLSRSWPDSLDVMLICIEAGMSLEPAMSRVAREMGTQSVPLAEELTLTIAELSYLQDRRKAFENLGKRTGLPVVKSVVTALIQSERYGTPLGQALRVLSQETRDQRMQEAEKKAASLPAKLTVPMILFFLPVVFIVILAPSIILIMG